VVEVDETLIGGVKPGKRGRGADGKALVVIAVERHDGGPGRVRMRRIPNAAADILTEFVLDHVARSSEIHTDGWGGYNDIGRYRFGRYVTNVSASGDPAHVAMPEVHRHVPHRREPARERRRVRARIVPAVTDRPRSDAARQTSATNHHRPCRRSGTRTPRANAAAPGTAGHAASSGNQPSSSCQLPG